MKTNERIESIGVLLKEETLQTVDHYVLENTLVLENLEPFPGYLGENLPTNVKPESLFLITDKPYPLERILRVSQHMCCQSIPIDACQAEISVQNSTYHGIRIRGLSNYSFVAEIQRCYLEKNILFMKKKAIHAPAIMKITKIFSAERIDGTIYKDLDDDNTFYLTIPYHFTWNLFQKVSFRVKNNLDNSNFDGASGFIYLRDMLEFVRIYAQDTDIVRLKAIREKYIEEIAKIRDDRL